MSRNKNLNEAARSARLMKANLTRSLLVLTAMIALASGAWLVSGCAQSPQTVEQNQQTRQRRATNANANELPAKTANAENSNNQMTDTDEEKKKKGEPVGFYTALESALAGRGMRLETVCDRNDPVARRILEDYGAVYVADKRVLPPPVCIFQSEAEVVKFQQAAGVKSAVVGGARIELQPAALAALQEAREEARREGLDITPRGGEEAARRSYEDTRRLWDTRFLPALSYWMKRGRLTKEQVARLKGLPIREQVGEVLELEKGGIYFSKDFSKSILYSIAAPGTSQHIMMLALDVDQFMNERVRRILARHGWFQTVKSDLPHFTYLGLDEQELPARGLRRVKSGSQLFWIPNVK